MARKRKKLNKLDYTSQEYWDVLLTDEGLSMERGRHHRLDYVGSGGILESIEGARRLDNGRILPKKTE